MDLFRFLFGPNGTLKTLPRFVVLRLPKFQAKLSYVLFRWTNHVDPALYVSSWSHSCTKHGVRCLIVLSCVVGGPVKEGSAELKLAVEADSLLPTRAKSCLVSLSDLLLQACCPSQ